MKNYYKSYISYYNGLISSARKELQACSNLKSKISVLEKTVDDCYLYLVNASNNIETGLTIDNGAPADNGVIYEIATNIKNTSTDFGEVISSISAREDVLNSDINGWNSKIRNLNNL